MGIGEQKIDVLIGGYLSSDAARRTTRRSRTAGHHPGRGRRQQGPDGELSVQQTDHMVREGAVGLGGVGFVVGLFAPPLLAATAIGAAAGAVAGKALHQKSGKKIEEAAGDTIPLGGAGLIVAYERDHAAVVEPAVTRAIQKVVGEADGHHVAALKGALADAQRKMAEQEGAS